MPQRDAERASGTSFVPAAQPGGPIARETTPARNGTGRGSPEPSGRDERLTESRSHSPDGDRIVAQPAPGLVLPVPLRVVMLYDMDACHGPTGVTRHALAQLERLARRNDVALRLISGRITHPDGLAYWESLNDLSRRELPIRVWNQKLAGTARIESTEPTRYGRGERI